MRVDGMLRSFPPDRGAIGSHQEILMPPLIESPSVIEAAGNQSALDLCPELVAQHGRIILIGYHQSRNGQRTVDMQQWNFKAIDVINGHVRRQDEKVAAMRKGMDLMQQGHINTEPLVSVYDLDDIETASAHKTSPGSEIVSKR